MRQSNTSNRYEQLINAVYNFTSEEYTRRSLNPTDFVKCRLILLLKTHIDSQKKSDESQIKIKLSYAEIRGLFAVMCQIKRNRFNPFQATTEQARVIAERDNGIEPNLLNEIGSDSNTDASFLQDNSIEETRPDDDTNPWQLFALAKMISNLNARIDRLATSRFNLFGHRDRTLNHLQEKRRHLIATLKLLQQSIHNNNEVTSKSEDLFVLAEEICKKKRNGFLFWQTPSSFQYLMNAKERSEGESMTL